jgi:DNA-binding NarL/FixJ family response regulator
MARPKRDRIRILIVDDHEIVRRGLRMLIDQAEGMSVVGEAGDVATAVAEASRLKPDVVLMDVRLPDGSGIEACRDIRATCPESRVLFLSSYSDDGDMVATIIAGASGYLLKEIVGQELIRAIEAVAKGQSMLDPLVMQRALTRMKAIGSDGAVRKDEDISPQERRVLALVAEGKTNKEIAAELDLSDKTVKNYLSHIFQKLRISRRSQAAAYFVQHRD